MRTFLFDIHNKQIQKYYSPSNHHHHDILLLYQSILQNDVDWGSINSDITSALLVSEAYQTILTGLLSTTVPVLSH
uniref:Uncharacterized protein n=1 Tax=Arion vulgaris TaxID=1028688 RepID=A0A0B7A5H4_9EUPU